MRLYNYLNEMDVLDLSNMISDMNDKIEQDCKPYLSLIKGKNPLARGLKAAKDKVGIKQVRKDRVPSGMDYETFKKFNKWLQDNNHNKRDKSISVSPKPEGLEMFAGSSGIIAYVFPIGKFSYSWIKAKDVNIHDPKTGWDDEMLWDLLWDYEDEEFENFFFTDEGFNTAYKNGYEIWINANKYYYVAIDALQTVKMSWDTKDQRFKG